MRAYFRKYPQVLAALLGVAIILAVLAVYERRRVLSSTTEMKLLNEARSEEIYTDTFYSEQLTDKEQKAFRLMLERLLAFEGGVTEFPEPLTGAEYLRVTSAIENENHFFYGFYEIPMTENDIYVKYDETDLTKIKEPVIAKAILFLSCAEGINEQGQYAEDGTVENLSAVEKGLSVNEQEKKQQVLERTEQIKGQMDEIIANIPQHAGEKETLDYFMDWMKVHLEYDSTLGEEANSFTTMDEVFERALAANNSSCVLSGKAGALGYTKLLSELCNQSGMQSHIVLGTWGRDKNEGYTMCVVELAGEEIYVDAAGLKSSELAKERYLTKAEALMHISPVSYFND